MIQHGVNPLLSTCRQLPDAMRPFAVVSRPPTAEHRRGNAGLVSHTSSSFPCRNAHLNTCAPAHPHTCTQAPVIRRQQPHSLPGFRPRQGSMLTQHDLQQSANLPTFGNHHGSPCNITAVTCWARPASPSQRRAACAAAPSGPLRRSCCLMNSLCERQFLAVLRWRPQIQCSSRRRCVQPGCCSAQIRVSTRTKLAPPLAAPVALCLSHHMHADALCMLCRPHACASHMAVASADVPLCAARS